METFSDRMSDLFVHGELIADVLKDGTKAVLLGGAVSIVNLFLTEQCELQRTRRVRDYADLIHVRDLAKSQPDERIGVIPLQYIEERIAHLESVLRVGHTTAAGGAAAIQHIGHSRWDTIFSMAPDVLLALAGFFMIFAVGSPMGSLGIIVTCVVTLIATYYLGHWTSRALDSRMIRRISQVFISLTICFVSFIVLGVLSGV